MTICSRHAIKRTARLAPLLFAVVLLLGLAQPAVGAPPEPTMSLAQLTTALESGPLSGHMMTTMSGTTPESIPLTVESVVEYSSGSLILFEATGTVIEEIGGVASGMSGSPVYVNDGGTDKLIGAVSYGDDFTLGGMALATPIEYMASVESDYAVGALAALQAPQPPKAGAYELDEPIRTSNGVAVTSVVVARSVKAAENVEAVSGQTVMAPLGILEIGGALPGSRTYKRVAAKLESTGLLIKAASGTGAWSGTPAPTLEAGSPAAVLFSQGAVWVGAAGTVTYVDGNTAMLFGHPFEELGSINAILTGGYVDGVWKSSYSPYKLIAPRDVKGTCVQDRTWGVAATLAQEPDLLTTATTVKTPTRTVNDTSQVSEWVVVSGAYSTLPGSIVNEVTYEALDQYSYPGSAETTTTIVVSDATGTYTVKRDNLWSSAEDVSYQVGRDTNSIIGQLVANPDGVLAPRIESVTVEATLAPQQRSARIADVTLPDGIKSGDNRVRIDYYGYGSTELKTVIGTLTIPAGMSLYGRLSVTPASWDQGDGCWCCCCCSDETTGDAPQTLAELVASANQTAKNSDLLLSYVPQDSSDDEDSEESETITATVPTGYLFDDYYSGSTARMNLRAQPSKVSYGGVTQASGWVQTSSNVTVDIYRQYAGSDKRVRVQTVKAKAKNGLASFLAMVPGLKKNATISASTAAVDGSLPGGASVAVKVGAKLWMSGTSRLTLHVRPGEADGTAKLQRSKNGRWVGYKNVKIKNGEGSVRLPKGTHTLRFKFSGSDLCAATTSRAYTISVR